MAERNLEGMINNNKLTDSGNYSLGGSSEILSFEDSPPPNSNEANFKAKLVEHIYRLMNTIMAFSAICKGSIKGYPPV